MRHRIPQWVASFAAGVATLLGPRVMRGLGRFNKYVTNRVVLRWAPRARHLAVVEHVGRRSGRTYRTPVMAFVEDGVLTVVLNYGSTSDWVRNVRAADASAVEHRGRRWVLRDPHVLAGEDADLPSAARRAAAGRSVLQATLAVETASSAGESSS